MITGLRIKNFKAWGDTGSMRLAPLTVIFGTNSSGKSSLGHLLLALKQTVNNTDRKRSLHLGDRSSLIDLGTFKDCLFNHDLDLPMEFAISWKLPAAIKIRDSLDRRKVVTGDELRLGVGLAADKQGQPRTEGFIYRLLQGCERVLQATHSRGGEGHPTLECDNLRLVRAQGRKWELEPPEKFYRFSDRTLARYQNADFLADFALETERFLQNVYYLGPLRSPPERVYQWAGDAPEDVGPRGEKTIPALLASTKQDRHLNRGFKKRKSRFDEFIACWLKDIGVISSFAVKPLAEGRTEYEVLVQTQESAPEVKLTDVGFGVSQILPALVQAFYAPKNSTVWMEQPEIHLHPRVQANLADTFISAIKSYEGGAPRNLQLIVESHSEHLLTRLQLRVAEGVLNPEDIAIYFVTEGEEGADLEPLRINLYGDIENWPEDFFGDEMGDIVARTKVAIERQLNEKRAS